MPRLGKAGRREWVQVPRLLEVFSAEGVEAAVGEAVRLGAIGFDAVEHLVLCRIERRPPRLDLESYPYLPRARVATTSARACTALLTQGTASWATCSLVTPRPRSCCSPTTPRRESNRLAQSKKRQRPSRTPVSPPPS